MATCECYGTPIILKHFPDHLDASECYGTPVVLQHLLHHMAASEWYGTPVVLQHFRPNTNTTQSLTPNLSLRIAYRVEHTRGWTPKLKSIHDQNPNLIPHILLSSTNEMRFICWEILTNSNSDNPQTQQPLWATIFLVGDDKLIPISYLLLSWIPVRFSPT